MDTTYDVIVIGGGLAGLTAAATASNAGVSVLVVDRQQPGGRATTDERTGYLLNRGAHALYRAGSAVEVLKRLGITPRGSVPTLDQPTVLVDGDLQKLPTGPGSLASSRWLGSRDKLQFSRLLGGVGLRPAHTARGLGSTSAASWLASLNLRPRVQGLVEALVRVTSYCSDLDRVSGDVTALQLGRGTRSGVMYLDGGWQQLVHALLARVPASLQARVDSIGSTPGGFAVEIDSGQYCARSIIVAAESAVSAHRLLAPLGCALPAPPTPNTVSAACLDMVTADRPTPSFILGIDDPVYLSLHSSSADLRAPAGNGSPRQGSRHVVHLLRYGARSASADRPLLEATARRAGLRPDAETSRFFADLTVVSDAPLPASGGLASRPDIGCAGLPGCYVAGDWVGPHDFLAGTSLASGERAGLAAAAHVAAARKIAGSRSGNSPETSVA